MISPRLTRLALVCLALLCITAVSVSATNIYTTAASDGYVYRQINGNYQIDRYGADTTSTAACVSDGSGFGWPYICAYGVLQFPVASLAGTTLAPHSVKLHVYTQQGYGPGSTVELLGVEANLGGAFSNPQDIKMNLENQAGEGWNHVAWLPLATSWQVVDVTADLQRQINAGHNWGGFFFSMLHNYDDARENQMSVSTYEDATHRPYLEVIPVPEPSSLMALMAGITGLGGMFIRRRK
jgi:hypothetical protein